MAGRSIEDRLREQYFDLVPSLTRIAQSLTTEIDYELRLVRKELASHESLVVKTRIKECQSAIDKLRRKFNPKDPTASGNPGGVFDPDRPELYSLLSLRDLVGVRVLVFPSERASQIDRRLRGKFPRWNSDPIMNGDEQLAYKYNGRRSHNRVAIPCEYQIVSTLIGLFWEVEHTALYKQAPNIKGLAPLMAEQTSEVYRALKSFEEDFEQKLRQSGGSGSASGPAHR